MVNEKSNGAIHEAQHCNEKQDVIARSANHQPEEKIIKADAKKSPVQNSTSKAKPASGSAVNGMTDVDPFEPRTPSLEDDKQNSCVNHASKSESNDSGEEVLTKSRDSYSLVSAKKSPTNYHCRNHYDEEDNWSMASSTATCVRMRVTVPVAPKFNCVNRLERRKEFYTKPWRKRKLNMKLEPRRRGGDAYKANPVPSFYREAPPPPPKVELKKLPVTRAKSPKLSRRKSCGDALKSDKEVCGRSSRHSVGAKASPVNHQMDGRIQIVKAKS